MNFKSILKGWFILFFVVVFSHSLIAQQEQKVYEKQVIRDVQVIGIPENLIIPPDLLLTKTGQRLITEFLEKDSVSLYKSGVLESISVTVIPTYNQVIVRFTCVPYPKIKRVYFVGRKKISQRKLRSLMKNRNGQVLNIAYLQSDKKQIETYYREKGYELFQIEKMEMDPSHNLVIQVNEGKIEEITFQGAEKISTEVLLKSMDSKPGTPFNTDTLRKDRERLLRHGYFSEIPSPVLKEGFSPNSIKILFVVKERKQNRIDLGLEQEEQEFVGFTKLVRNHTLQQGDLFSGKVQIGTLNTKKLGINSYSVQYSQPWFLNRFPFSVDLDVWEDLKEEIAPNQFHSGQQTIESTERIGEAISIGYPFKLDMFTFQTRLKNETVSPRETSVFPSYSLHSISGILSYRNIPSLFNPKSGNYIRLEIEQGGNLGIVDVKGIDFSRTTINGAHFMRLKKGSTIGFHSSMGIFETHDPATFDTESFVIGGVNSLRGYNENRFPFFGTRKILYNIEYRQDINETSQWVAFIDAGKTFDQGWSFTNNLHFGVGVGFRYFTPIGPIRLDFAQGEEDFFIHFGLGQLF